MAKKEARPEMHWSNAKQCWRKRIFVDGKYKDIHGKTQEEVREKVRAIQQKVDSGLVINDKMTVAALSKEWFNIKKTTVRKTSSNMYASCLSSHILPFFGHMNISDVRPMHIQKCLAERSELSHSQQSKILTTISQIMRMAVENRMISRNPCDGIRAAGTKPKEVVPLSDEEQQLLLEGLKGQRVEVFAMLCLYAGLRREEALGLLWPNVELGDVPYIKVRHSVVYEGNAPTHSSNLKTPAAKREIPIPDILADKLRAAKENASSFFVVPAPRSKGAMPETTYERMWNKAKEIIPGVHAHRLRHTYLTTLCASGMDIKKIQYLAGHEDVNMTLRIYTHAKGIRPEEMHSDIKKAFSGDISGEIKEANG